MIHFISAGYLIRRKKTFVFSLKSRVSKLKYKYDFEADRFQKLLKERANKKKISCNNGSGPQRTGDVMQSRLGSSF